MIRVVLVNPPQDLAISSELPWFISRQAGVFPPLGLMYIAAYLKAKIDCRVLIIDSMAEKKNVQATIAAVQAFSPDMVGISAYTQNLPTIVKLVKGVKAMCPRAHVSIGGPHVSLFSGESVSMEGVDSVIPGEGEVAFLGLVEALSRGRNPAAIPGILFKDQNRVSERLPAAVLPDINDYPFPDRHALGLERYHYVLGSEKGFLTTMISSRGCSGSCSFCSTPRTRTRTRTPANIVEEMEACVGMGVREIHFVDDTFNEDPRQVINVCEEIHRRKVSVRWGIRARADKLDRAQLQALKASGCSRINIGVETSSDEGLRRLRKGITISQVMSSFRMAREEGIITTAYFMLGCPHERNLSDVRKTIDFALELNPDYAMFNIFALYPGTLAHKEAVDRSLLDKDYWMSFVKDPRQDFSIPFWEEFLDRDELQRLLQEAYRRFYLRPGYARKVLQRAYGAGAFFRRLVAGANIIRGGK